MMKRILVSGSSGFIGRNFCHALTKGNYQVIEIPSSKEFDLCDSKKVALLPEVDVIIHLAAKSYIPDSFNNPSYFYQNNVVSTLNLLEKSRKDKAKFILLSTYIYGNPQYLPIDEKHQRSALNPYTQSKLICEDLCQAYARDFGLHSIILRPFNVYGPGQLSSFLLPSIISQLNNEEIFLQDSRPKRDYVFIDDLVEAILLSIEVEKEGCNVYNVGSGSSYSVNELVDMLVQISKSTSQIRFANIERKGEVLNTIADIKKINSDLGWFPLVDLQEGLIRTFNSAKK
ncbi:NAD-dependent epimerase/dehydratase family protein [Aquirufa nivalisilvae]|uniref:NAD-dependent epimerase/dehydratase family protein n=1 Tax=Aquirufa nivalisilvae TaxID=2516557 RepID=UPI0022A98731|nr:NAD-dependent epimerase/dehydratase family protein [Aquirufa nivalisilvae]MCZ2479772.1 NAD-dependent epimerase/dehydratase family protein [Aquirufa nivalisilvae]MCZ2481767.1 NAD-dependent epimerase/dehydratase family protein [Aquirufa nivalisilvae]